MRIKSLYQKLILYFLIVIILPVGSVGLISYMTSSKELDVQAQNQMAQIVGNAAHHTELYLRDYERTIMSLLTLPQVMEFIDLPADRDDYDFFYYRKIIREIGANPLFIQNPRLAAIYLMSAKGNTVYYLNESGEELFGEENIRRQRDYFLGNTSPDAQLNILDRSILDGQQHQMLTLVRRIRGFSSSELNNFAAVEIRPADLSALWNGVDLGEYGSLFIIDAKGRYVYHPDQAKVGEPAPSSFLSRLEGAGEQAFVGGDESGEEIMYMARVAEFSGWRLVVSMPLEELRRPVANIRTTTLIVGALSLLLAVLLAYRFGRSITRPIQLLKSGMRETEKGNWAPIPLPRHRDEIVELMLRYNKMVKRLSEAVDHVVQVELNNQEIRMERQKAEYQSLQLQINPHFLYNTLETIVCYAAVQESDEISEIVKALAYMLRYSVQTNVEEITVANELKHVMHYLIVMQHRIGREFEIDVDVKPEFLLHAMVRLSLQPLVENAFQHAFPDGVEDYHFIRIDCEEEGGVFRVIVEDNGCGIEPGRLRELREKLGANRLADGGLDAGGSRSGIGIMNVHRRVQMVFGDQYGLRIDSEEQRGTKMTLVMPAPGHSGGDAAEEGS
ncbi:cache domain-containing sensor histidine kinase [Paenibacillus ginsengarvi]|uniref:Sensor histidine kinase n=1 Tax=Paenibacillus ginsengarvi TaxID=400777 RepID=A0A3B0C4U8_9BACL|nr:sensor histidine kinase [Paenibacillus ginsengarvi]RKN79184.1 sensor histidine kinase [Paenibacillus ginsengarvi]